MAKDKNLLGDVARLAGGAASLISTVSEQVKTDIKGRIDNYAGHLDLASREALDELLALVAKYRLEQEAMKKRISELEKSLGGARKAASTAGAKAPAKSGATKKPAAKSPANKSSAKKGKR